MININKHPPFGLALLKVIQNTANFTPLRMLAKNRYIVLITHIPQNRKKSCKYVDSYRQITWFTQYGEISQEEEVCAAIYQHGISSFDPDKIDFFYYFSFFKWSIDNI
jgi:hypothetical protein